MADGHQRRAGSYRVLMGIIVGFILMSCLAGVAGATAGQDLYFSTTTPTPTSAFVTCGSGCQCLFEFEIPTVFGESGRNYVKCSETPCGQGTVVEVRQYKYCFRPHQQPAQQPPVQQPQVPAPGASTGSLSVSSTPSGASVTLDGQYRGNTPVTIQYLSPGYHDLRLSLSGYQESTQSPSVSSGTTTALSISLTPSGRGISQVIGGEPQVGVGVEVLPEYQDDNVRVVKLVDERVPIPDYAGGICSFDFGKGSGLPDFGELDITQCSKESLHYIPIEIRFEKFMDELKKGENPALKYKVPPRPDQIQEAQKYFDDSELKVLSRYSTESLQIKRFNALSNNDQKELTQSQFTSGEPIPAATSAPSSGVCGKGDGVPDVCDNCRSVFNENQKDDADKDCDVLKLNPNFWNPTTHQWSLNQDPKCGDACDRCPGIENYGQDSDSDGVDDACDNCWMKEDWDNNDSDGDCEFFKKDPAFYDTKKQRWLKDPKCGDACDNCPSVFNPNWRDTNSDGKGDACSCTWCKDYVVPLWLNGKESDKMNIILMPATDYGSDQVHAYKDMEEFIDKGYGITFPISGNITKFNFYYMNISAEAAVTQYPSCGFTPPNNNCTEFEEATSFAAATGVVTTQQTFRAWAGYACNRRIFTIKSHNNMVIIHETGHAAFALGDEYCCDSHYWASPNLYPYTNKANTATDFDCQQARKQQGGYGSCDLFCPPNKVNCGSGWYTIDTNDCFMRGPPPNPQFLPASACYNQVKSVLGKLP